MPKRLKSGLTHTAKEPDYYTKRQQQLEAWPKILQDCSAVGQYLEAKLNSSHIPDPDIEFIGLSVQEQRHQSGWGWWRREHYRTLVRENEYALGWIIAKDGVVYDPEATFKVIKGKLVEQPKEFSESYFAITNGDGLVKLESPRVPVGTEHPFGELKNGVLRVPVPNLRPRHIEDDEKEVFSYLYDRKHENDFSDSLWVRTEIYKRSLVGVWDNKLVNADIADAGVVLSGLRSFYNDLD